MTVQSSVSQSFQFMTGQTDKEWFEWTEKRFPDEVKEAKRELTKRRNG